MDSQTTFNISQPSLFLPLRVISWPEVPKSLYHASSVVGPCRWIYSHVTLDPKPSTESQGSTTSVKSQTH